MPVNTVGPRMRPTPTGMLASRPAVDVSQLGEIGPISPRPIPSGVPLPPQSSQFAPIAPRAPQEFTRPVAPMIPPDTEGAFTMPEYPREDLFNFQRPDERYPQLAQEILNQTQQSGGFRDTLLFGLAAQTDNPGLARMAGMLMARDEKRRNLSSEALRTFAEVEAHTQDALQRNTAAYGNVAETYRSERAAPYDRNKTWQESEAYRGRAENEFGDNSRAEFTLPYEVGKIQSEIGQNDAQAGSANALAHRTNQTAGYEKLVQDAERPFIGGNAYNEAAKNYHETLGEGYKARQEQYQAEHPNEPGANVSFPNTREGWAAKQAVTGIDSALSTVRKQISAELENKEPVNLDALRKQELDLMTKRQQVIGGVSTPAPAQGNKSKEQSAVAQQTVSPEEIGTLAQGMEKLGYTPDEIKQEIAKDPARFAALARKRLAQGQ